MLFISSNSFRLYILLHPNTSRTKRDRRRVPKTTSKKSLFRPVDDRSEISESFDSGECLVGFEEEGNDLESFVWELTGASLNSLLWRFTSYAENEPRLTRTVLFGIRSPQSISVAEDY